MVEGLEQLAAQTEELLSLGLWDSAEILARVLAAASTTSASSRAGFHALLGDALYGKGELQTAEQHYLEALQSYRLDLQSKDSGAVEETKAQVHFKLARCNAQTCPRKAISILEAVHPEQRSAAILSLLGDLYQRCGYFEAAQGAYKACLEKCPFALEAAMAAAQLGVAPEKLAQMLKQPRQECSNISSQRLIQDGKEAAARDTSPASKACSPHSLPGSGKLPESPGVGEKRTRSASGSPERKRPALNDRTAIENAWSAAMLAESPCTDPPGNSPAADENGKEVHPPAAPPEGSAALRTPEATANKLAHPVEQHACDWVQLLLQGCAAEAEEDPGRAVKSFSALVGRSPGNLYPLLRLASAQAAAGESAIAIELFERCRRLEPANTRQMDDYAMLLYHKGKLLELGQLAFSLAPLGAPADSPASPQRSPSRSSPEFWVASSAYLVLCGSAKEVALPGWRDKALQNIQQAFDAGVEHAALQFLKGDLLSSSQGDKNAMLDAMVAYEASHRLRPSCHTLMGAARAGLAVGKHPAALEFAREAARSGGAEALAFHALVHWEARKQIREALELAEVALSQDPDHSFAIATKAKLLCIDKRQKEAIALLEGKLATRPCEHLHAQLGHALRLTGQTRDAVLQFQAALILNPDNALAQKGLTACEGALKAQQSTQTPPAKEPDFIFGAEGRRKGALPDAPWQPPSPSSSSDDEAEEIEPTPPEDGSIVLPYPNLLVAEGGAALRRAGILPHTHTGGRLGPGSQPRASPAARFRVVPSAPTIPGAAGDYVNDMWRDLRSRVGMRLGTSWRTSP